MANRSVLLAIGAIASSVLLAGHLNRARASQSTDRHKDQQIRDLYKHLIDAENGHDLPAVRDLVWNSPSTLFVAKAPVGWHGYWGIDDVTYAPVRISVAYGGQNPVPKPFIMVLVWLHTAQGWKMTTDIPIPVPPDPTPH